MPIKTVTILMVACLVVQTFEGHNASYTKLYQEGINAYKEERWFECYNRVQQAIERHREHQNLLIQCRLLCQRAGTLPDVETLASVGLVVAVSSAECSRRCLRDGGDVEGPQGDSSPPDISSEQELEIDFELLKPYDYLQICAYHSGQIGDALSAAYTFSLAHPNHEYMGKNVQLYRDQPGASDSFLVNLEEQKHQALFEQGAKHYNAGDFKQTAISMEEAIREYYVAEERCSALCDRPVNDANLKSIDKSNINLIKSSLYDHWIAVLQCKAECPRKQGTIKGLVLENYHIELYNYLQFSYYKLEDMRSAAQCAATYLLFLPQSESMQRNKNIYVADRKVTSSDLEPRPDAKQYHAKKERERSMLEELLKKKTELDLTSLAQENHESRSKIKKTLDGISVALFNNDSRHFTEPIDDFMTSHGLVVSMDTEALLGNKRVVIDGILTQQKCRQLVNLYKAALGKRTDNKVVSYFLTMDEAAKLSRQGVVEADEVYDYLHTVDLARAVLEKYFQVASPLLFQQARLFCSSSSSRSDKDDDGEHDDDDDDRDSTVLSFTENDFIGMLHLTDDFQGGEFAFTSSNGTTEKLISALIGRLVAMGGTNHYDLPSNIQSGERCVIAMTFTCNPANQLPAYSSALSILQRMRAPEWETDSEDLKSFMNAGGYKVVQTDIDLNGPERFTADHLVKPQQCAKLIEMANKVAVTGDGYYHNKASHRPSPHTDHEKFVGLTVRKAAELAAEYKISSEAVELYAHISEQAMEFTRLYFNVDKLYFAFIHLVCRTALDDAVKRQDLSHPIHTDNSVIQPDGSSIRMRPAYTERDYSAIVYLNGDFSGGEFFFAHQNFSMQSSIHPDCGTMVSFNSGNYHGVRAVEAGQRCAIALWFTKDKRYEDDSADFAKNILNQLSSAAFGPNQNPRHSEL